MSVSRLEPGRGAALILNTGETGRHRHRAFAFSQLDGGEQPVAVTSDVGSQVPAGLKSAWYFGAVMLVLVVFISPPSLLCFCLGGIATQRLGEGKYVT